MQQTVSLIIPVFNEAPHLERFLDGIDKLALPLRKDSLQLTSRSGSLIVSMLSSKIKTPTQIFQWVVTISARYHRNLCFFVKA